MSHEEKVKQHNKAIKAFKRDECQFLHKATLKQLMRNGGSEFNDPLARVAAQEVIGTFGEAAMPGLVQVTLRRQGPQKGDHPVVHITEADAKEWCKQAGFPVPVDTSHGGTLVKATEAAAASSSPEAVPESTPPLSQDASSSSSKKKKSSKSNKKKNDDAMDENE